MSWIRARFYTDENDWRPIKFPPPGPAWCTGFTPENAIVVAYVQSEDQILEYWPDAVNIEAEPREEITFTDRLPKPDWWTPPLSPQSLGRAGV
jgi:hypothetical protein